MEEKWVGNEAILHSGYYFKWLDELVISILNGIVIHTPNVHCVKPYKLMLHIVLATHVARGTEVIIVTSRTLPSHASHYILLRTPITAHIRVRWHYTETDKNNFKLLASR